MAVKVKRAYAPAEAADGYRVLIDRLWPRGIRNEEAHLDEWAKEWRPRPSCGAGSDTTRRHAGETARS